MQNYQESFERFKERENQSHSKERQSNSIGEIWLEKADAGVYSHLDDIAMSWVRGMESFLLVVEKERRYKYGINVLNLQNLSTE